jgi:hypothetical protein
MSYVELISSGYLRDVALRYQNIMYQLLTLGADVTTILHEIGMVTQSVYSSFARRNKTFLTKCLFNFLVGAVHA